jgi:hypothetical protein
MINLSINDAGLTRLEQSLLTVARKQIPYAAARALNDCARAAATGVNGMMAETFDRPNAFTSRAVIAPRDLAAQTNSLSATVTVQPIQAKYLLHEEIGGTRTPAENTLRPGAQAIVLPGRALLLDKFGGIPAGAIGKIKAKLDKIETAKRLKRQAARSKAKQRRANAVKPGDRGFFYVPRAGFRQLPGGFYQRLPGHRIAELIGFAPETHYRPRMHYNDHVRGIATATWPAAFLRRLIEAASSAR